MQSFQQILDRLKSFGSFLRVPLAVVALFAILAAVTYRADSALSSDAVKDHGWLAFLDETFGDRESTRSVLSTLSSALITVTSITFSMLLVAVQQGASSFSSQILDQFLKRRSNQFYFGFFVGLCLFTLITLATTHGVHHPLFGALLAIIGTVAALCMILVLIYTTVQQMRSGNVIGAIATMTRSARDGQRDLLNATRAAPDEELPVRFCCTSDASGTVATINVELLAEAALACSPDPPQIVLKAAQGSYVGRDEEVAEVRCRTQVGDKARENLGDAIRKAVIVSVPREANEDPRVGIHQLATIGWNSASSARSNPEPPSIVCHTIAEMVWDWTDEPFERDPNSSVVYPDLLLADCTDAFDSILVAAAESKQHQTAAQVFESYSRILPRLDLEHRRRAETGLRLALGSLSQHIPTVKLNTALERLEDALRNLGSGLADEVRGARRSEVAQGEFSDTAVRS